LSKRVGEVNQILNRNLDPCEAKKSSSVSKSESQPFGRPFLPPVRTMTDRADEINLPYVDAI
jgi:hypothetical protein